MTQLHHVGYWVDDLDAAMERASRTLDVGPFLVHPHVAFDSFTLADGTEITDPDYFDHSAAFAAWGPIVLELGVVHTVHPDLEAAYAIRTGEVGHVSWVVDDLEAESRRLGALGCELIHTEVGGGSVHVAWHRGGRCSRTPSRSTLPGRRSSGCSRGSRPWPRAGTAPTWPDR